MELPVEKSRVTLEWSPWSGLGQDEVSLDIESVMIKESKSGVNTKTGSAGGRVDEPVRDRHGPRMSHGG
jgi:hypothetical protein